MKKVFGYIQAANEAQARQHQEAMNEYCRQYQLELVQTFVDIGKDAASLDREELIELLAILNGVNAVLVRQLKHLWESETAMLLIKRKLIKSKTEIISIAEPKYSLEQDLFSPKQSEMLEFLNDYEQFSNQVKLAKGRKSKVKTGIKGCGEAPIGYKWKHDDVEQPVVVVDAERAAVVREIFHQYLELGSIGKVKKYLNERGYKTNRGNEFTDMSVRNILTNDFYSGIVTWGDLERQGQHEAIVTKDIFDKVQAQLERNNKKHD